MRHSFAVYVCFEGMWQKMSLHYLCLLLLLLQSYNYRYGPLNVAPGMYSRKTVSNGLYLPATILPSNLLLLLAQKFTLLISKTYATFIHYQITMSTPYQDFYSKLLINYANAGSLYWYTV